MPKTYILIYRHIPIEIADQFLGSSNKRSGSFYKTSDWRMKFKPNTTNCCFIVGINFVIINWWIGSLKKRLLEFTLELLGCNDDKLTSSSSSIASFISCSSLLNTEDTASLLFFGKVGNLSQNSQRTPVDKRQGCNLSLVNKRKYS